MQFHRSNVTIGYLWVSDSDAVPDSGGNATGTCSTLVCVVLGAFGEVPFDFSLYPPTLLKDPETRTWSYGVK